MKKFFAELYQKYAHVRTVLLGLNTVQGFLVGLHPTTPASVRIVSGAIWIIGVIVWYLRGPHTDVSPAAPTIAKAAPKA